MFSVVNFTYSYEFVLINGTFNFVSLLKVFIHLQLFHSF